MGTKKIRRGVQALVARDLRSRIQAKTTKGNVHGQDKVMKMNYSCFYFQQTRQTTQRPWLGTQEEEVRRGWRCGFQFQHQQKQVFKHNFNQDWWGEVWQGLSRHPFLWQVSCPQGKIQYITGVRTWSLRVYFRYLEKHRPQSPGHHQLGPRPVTSREQRRRPLSVGQTSLMFSLSTTRRRGPHLGLAVGHRRICSFQNSLVMMMRRVKAMPK